MHDCIGQADPDVIYCQLLRELLSAPRRDDRTGVGTRSVFGREMRFDCTHYFPLLTTKKVHWRSVVVELLWFLRGESNIQYLHDHGVTIWDEWADDQGELGPVYGRQWRAWQAPNGQSIDQVAGLIEGICRDPYSRRHIISAWNVGQLAEMALPPCHAFIQFYVADGRLSSKLTQRSADIFLGVPFNIASYALLTQIIARACGLAVGEFIWSGGDVHLYENHIEQAKLQLSRQPASERPVCVIDSHSPWDQLSPEDIQIINYHPHPAIKAPVAV